MSENTNVNTSGTENAVQEQPAAPPPNKKKKFQMPSAYVIVFFAMLLTLALTWVIPVSVHDPETGAVVYNAVLGEDGTVIENAGPQAAGLWDLLMAPVVGFQSAANVGIALLIAGGFLNVMNRTGSLEAGFGKMLKRLPFCFACKFPNYKPAPSFFASSSPGLPSISPT